MMHFWFKPFRLILFFLLGTLIFGSLSACQRQSAEPISSRQPTDCHWVDHTAGRTCVPDQIERLVTLDSTSFEAAIALGLKPIGTVVSQGLDTYLADQLADVADIGQAGEPNIESIVALKPDFILGLDHQQSAYEQLSQIAPTVLLPFDHSGQWKEVFASYSQVLNQETIRQQVMDDYQRRAQAFQQQLASQLPSDLASSLQVSVVRMYPDSINLYFRESFPGTVLDDAGLARPTEQDISAAEAKSRYQNPIQASISLERLDYADGDAIFIWTAENTEEANQTAQKKLAELKADPLWQNLKAVQEDRIYSVPSYWIGSGPLAANGILDDLFKYLIKEP